MEQTANETGGFNLIKYYLQTLSTVNTYKPTDIRLYTSHALN